MDIPNWSFPFLTLIVLSRAADRGGMPDDKLGEGTGDITGVDMMEDTDLRSLVATGAGGL